MAWSPFKLPSVAFVRPSGIEPPFALYQNAVLTIELRAIEDSVKATSKQNRIQWTYRDSNPEPSPCHGVALPLELQALI